MTTPTEHPMSEERQDVEGRDWSQYAVWNKNGHKFICHAVDGDDCIGPIPHLATAERILNALRDLREQVERLRGERDGWFEALQAESERVLAARSRVAALQEEVEGHAAALLNATAHADTLQRESEALRAAGKRVVAEAVVKEAISHVCTFCWGTANTEMAVPHDESCPVTVFRRALTETEGVE